MFEHEKWHYITITFVLGAIVPYIIYPIHSYIYHPLNIGNSNDPFESLLFFTLGVGLLEESVKLLPLIIVLKFFKQAVNEPLDYIKYICVSALGFAFGENIEYALGYGHEVLIGRSILSVPAHMFFSATFIYGFVLYKYNGKPAAEIAKYGCVGFISHGLYDFLLDFDLHFLGFLLMLVFFMLLISVFINILNNCLNNSPFYTPKKAIDQERVRIRMAWCYFTILLLVLVYGVFNSGNFFSLLANLIFLKSSILFIIIVRLSRFSIIPALWQPVRLELPFYYKNAQERDDMTTFFGLLTVKGETYNDAAISALYEEEIRVVPLSWRKSLLGKTHKGIIEKKVFVNGATVYVLKVWLDEAKLTSRYFDLKAKRNGVTHTEDNFPIASLNSPQDNRLIFHEWVILKKKE